MFCKTNNTMNFKYLTRSFLAGFLFFLAACGQKTPEFVENPPHLEAGMEKPSPSHTEQIRRIKHMFPESISMESGVHYLLEQEGVGEAKPSKGDKVIAHYTGYLANGEIFDSSRSRGKPFEFSVGAGKVIKAWDESFLAMKKGEKRTIVIPSESAYGARGAGGVIPPFAILIFEIELIDF